MQALDAGHGGLILVALGSAILAWRRGRMVESLRTQLAGLYAEPNRKGVGREAYEFRVEQFDLLWFPTVVVSPSTLEITSVKPGVPYCRSCVVALSLGEGQNDWACPKCRSRYPGTLADLMVTDTISSQAIKYFQERHKEYRVSLKS